MKIEYKNLYTHFVLITFQRTPFINSQIRERIEKYITGIVNNKDCKMYAIYANPQHVHFLISRSPSISEETIATIIANSSTKFINDNKFVMENFPGNNLPPHFRYRKEILKMFVNTFLTNLNTIV